MAASDSLKIEKVVIHPVLLPLVSPFKIATMTAMDSPNVFVQVQVKGGLTGWGEASFMQAINGETQATVTAALEGLAPLLIGKSAAATRSLWDFASRTLPGQAAARCALDCALWDLAAQASGLSICEMLGGESRLMETDMTISAVAPEEAEDLAAKLASEGFRAIKLKIGTGVPADAARHQAVVKGAEGRARVRLDANQGYSRLEAHQAFSGDLFEGAEFCEQPLARADLEGMAWLSQLSRVPVMADESLFTASDAASLSRACPLANVKISKSGGITGAVMAAEVLEAHGMTAMMGGMMESRLGVTASAQAASARRVFRYFDLDAHKDHSLDPILGGIQIKGGDVHLPEGPGLGASVDEAFLRQFPRIVVE